MVSRERERVTFGGRQRWGGGGGAVQGGTGRGAEERRGAGGARHVEGNRRGRGRRAARCQLVQHVDHGRIGRDQMQQPPDGFLDPENTHAHDAPVQSFVPESNPRSPVDVSKTSRMLSFNDGSFVMVPLILRVRPFKSNYN